MINNHKGKNETYERKKNLILKQAELHKLPEEFIGVIEKAIESLPKKGKGNFFLEIGEILQRTCSYPVMALKVAQHALNYFVKEKNKSGEAKCYILIGFSNSLLGNFTEVIEFHEKALEICQEIKDELLESDCFFNLSIAYCDLCDFPVAIAYGKKALGIKKKHKNILGEAKCYVIIGNAHRGLGDFLEAIEYYKKSLKIFQENEDQTEEAGCYLNLGFTYQSLGDFLKAISYLEKALDIFQKFQVKIGESTCYVNLGNAYFDLGNMQSAIEYHEKALKIFEETRDKSGQAKCYVNLGNAYFVLRDICEAINYYERALKIKLAIHDKSGESKCYTGLAISYVYLDNFTKAIEFHEKALGICQEIKDSLGQADCYFNLGIVYRRLGDSHNSIKHGKQALEIFQKLGTVASQINANLALGLCYYDSNPELALSYIKRSIELSECVGNRLIDEMHKISFYDKSFIGFQYIIPLCLKLGKEKEAFEYSERSRSRAFLDLLATTQIKPTIHSTEIEPLVTEEKKYLVKLQQIQTRHLGKKAPELMGAENIYQKLDEIYTKIQTIDPEYVFMRKAIPLSLDRIQAMISSMKKRTVLVEYFTTDNEIFIFVVSKEKKIHIETVQLSREKLLEYLNQYLIEIWRHPYSKDSTDTWFELSNYLIKPISKYIVEAELIYFVPHGLLHYFPMHALKLNSEPLIKAHSVVYSPSASLLNFCRSKGSGNLKNCIFFGVEFKDEAKNLAKLFGVTACINSSVVKEKISEMCANKDIIHFSCHGRFNSIDPLSSGIQLYNNEVLTAREIFDFRINPELVTLSACETGLNKTSPGDELIGLTRALIYAGAPSVVVSLWQVNAPCTRELMCEFYKLLKDGTDKATALQMAQKKIMNKEKYTHPYYWSPFILIGDWE